MIKPNQKSKTMSNSSDLKFFTNNDEDSLFSRFKATLKDADFFDVLVGYFRTSGFNRLSPHLKTIRKIRILVGLNIDKSSFEIIQSSKRQSEMEFASHKECRQNFSDALCAEMNESVDSMDVERAAKQFIEGIASGKIELRVHPSKNIHAKVYITRFQSTDRDYGRVVTGSSNFSENGLVAQREFNVELKDKADVGFALARFDELWKEGVAVTEDYVDTIKTKTWLSDSFTPYQVYLKFLYEYFKEDINADEEADLTFPPGFMELDYQKQAVAAAKKILDTYDGVFLSDVVGLGKTFITALLLQKLPAGRKLVICPPVLIDYWRETLHQFYVPGFDVESLGKLEHLLSKGVEKYDFIVVDEAHRFRNELTSGYESLHKICRNKKVILVSATPLNNKLEDIKSQLKLFQPVKESSIPGVRNLEAFFRSQQKVLERYEKGSAEYLDAVTRTSEQVRDKVLKHVMVRRTRTEIKNYFSDDIKNQGLVFPEMGEPQRIIYKFDSSTDRVFSQTIELLRDFGYSRYTPLLYLKKQLTEFEQQSQRNVGGFMKGILVKRLESSFYAFRKSLARFVKSYERYIEMFDNGVVWISNKVDVFELLDADNEDKLLEMLDDEKAQKFESKDFQRGYRDKLTVDLQILRSINKLWAGITSDPKADFFIQELTQNKILRGKKVLIFSESKETVEYLQERLSKAFPGEVLSYASSGGVFEGQYHRGDFLREVIEANYKPGHPNPDDKVRILITTDVLAEGINLHRSNVVINYDLPWNPTRVLQRVGRINRVGTEHDEVFVFNIFPTSQSDEHLGLENNIKAKLQAFHNTLGEDAKYLSDDEELSTHELFGDRLYGKLNDKRTYDGDDFVADSELKYLKVIRTVRDKDTSLFAEIKKLPKKARTARAFALDAGTDNALVSFFRKGRLKKFVLSDGALSHELTFLEAAKIFECLPSERRKNVTGAFYELLHQNKDFLEELTTIADIDMSVSRGGASNEAQLIKTIKAVAKFDGFTEDDEAYMLQIRKALEAGSVPKNTAKKIKQSLKGKLQPLNVLRTLREHISENELYQEINKPKRIDRQEIILSELLIGGES